MRLRGVQLRGVAVRHADGDDQPADTVHLDPAAQLVELRRILRGVLSADPRHDQLRDLSRSESDASVASTHSRAWAGSAPAACRVGVATSGSCSIGTTGWASWAGALAGESAGEQPAEIRAETKSVTLAPR
jgi:hypothetical protein